MSELETACRRERARSDRTGRVFSLVGFRAPESDPTQLAGLLRVLDDRVRAADHLGRLDDSRLGVLLPETDGQGAWTFAEDVLQRLARGLKVDCQVYVYPKDWEEPLGAGEFAASAPRQPLRRVGDDDERPRREARAVGQLVEAHSSPVERTVLDLEPFFYQALPTWRRVMDVGVSASLLVLLSPLFLLTALAVKLTSRGPVIFRQQRAGLGGAPFTFYKFRSMCVGAEALKAELEHQNEADETVFKIKRDSRVTPVGRFLRRSSIDELPQLWNVLKGDMTLVGPRPPTLDEVPRYKPWQRPRLSGPMGLTCLREVSGRSHVKFEDWVRMDLRYLSRRSAWLDVKLLFRTVTAVFSGRGAY